MAGLLHQTAAYKVLHTVLYTHVLYIAKRDCTASEIFTIKKDTCIAECIVVFTVVMYKDWVWVTAV